MSIARWMPDQVRHDGVRGICRRKKSSLNFPALFSALILHSSRHRMGQRRLVQAGGELGAMFRNVRDIVSGDAGGGEADNLTETTPPLGCE